jgi:hypothetical protein
MLEKVGTSLFVRSLTFAVLLAFTLLGTARADDACFINVAGNTASCPTNPFVWVNGNRAIAPVDVNGYASVILRVYTCNPSGYSVHIGDSPSSNGGGGDSGSTQHDAELQLLDSTLSVFRSDYFQGEEARRLSATSSGCVTQQYLIRNDYAEFDPNVNVAGDFITQVPQYALFDFIPYDEYDAEDPNGNYAHQIYIGLNRVYYLWPTDRIGSGVQYACIYRSTSFYPNLATVTSACGI